jgi:hypothetical protein
VSKPTLAYLRAVRDLNLHVPDTPAFREAQAQKNRLLRAALSEQQAREVEAENFLADGENIELDGPDFGSVVT